MHKYQESDYYVVWNGRIPGIFHSSKQFERSVAAFPGARYKAFASLDQARKAYRNEWKFEEKNDYDCFEFYQSTLKQYHGFRASEKHVVDNINQLSERQKLSMMFGCSGQKVVNGCSLPSDENFLDFKYLFVGKPRNESIAALGHKDSKTGLIYFSGVDVYSGEVLFEEKSVQGISLPAAHFLASVYGLMILKERGDSEGEVFTKSSISTMFRMRRYHTLFNKLSVGSEQYNLLMAALDWVQLNQCDGKVLKWHEEEWGPMPQT